MKSLFWPQRLLACPWYVLSAAKPVFVAKLLAAFSRGVLSFIGLFLACSLLST